MFALFPIHEVFTVPLTLYRTVYSSIFWDVYPYICSINPDHDFARITAVEIDVQKLKQKCELMHFQSIYC
jgi:hypothetical protein